MSAASWAAGEVFQLVAIALDQLLELRHGPRRIADAEFLGDEARLPYVVVGFPRIQRLLTEGLVAAQKAIHLAAWIQASR